MIKHLSYENNYITARNRCCNPAGKNSPWTPRKFAARIIRIASRARARENITFVHVISRAIQLGSLCERPRSFTFSTSAFALLHRRGASLCIYSDLEPGSLKYRSARLLRAHKHGGKFFSLSAGGEGLKENRGTVAASLLLGPREPIFPNLTFSFISQKLFRAREFPRNFHGQFGTYVRERTREIRSNGLSSVSEDQPKSCRA